MGKKTTFASRRHSDIFTPSKAHDSSTNNGDDSGKNQDGHNFHATSKQFKFPASVLSGTKRSGKLDLHNQWLHCIPEFVFTDPHVGEHAKLVDLSYNKLDEVDPRLLNLRKSLRILNLSNNNIKRLDPSLGNMLGLRFICLDNNPLEPDIRRYYIKGRLYSYIHVSRALF